MKVLFVEDDPMNRRVVRDMLSVVGAALEEAPEADTGLRMIDENTYDLVLMDCECQAAMGSRRSGKSEDAAT